MPATLSNIPELIELIYRETDAEEIIPLLVTCRGFFDTLVPLVWERLSGCEIVLALIEGVKVIEEGSFITIELPLEVSEVNYTRLKLYAPYIKRLELCRKYECRYTLHNWDALLDASWASPLLPNLNTLTLANPGWCSSTESAQLPLMLMFISPSLTEYRITWEYRYYAVLVSKPRVVAILYALQQKCPNLRTLMLFSHDQIDCHEDEYRLIPLEYDPADFFRIIQPRVLSISLSMINSLPTPSLISQVAELKIHHDEGSLESLADPSLEWPNMYQLSTYSVYSIETISAFWSIAPLASRLTRITIQFRASRYSSTSMNTALRELVVSLAEGCPKLKVLSLYRRAMPYEQLINPNFLIHALSTIELRDLRINYLKTHESPDSGVQARLQGRVFTSLERLDLKRYQVGIYDLRFYARSMPNLRYLRVRVEIPDETVKYEETVSYVSAQECQLFVDGVRLESESSEAVWDNPSKFLLAVWPKIKLLLGKEIAEQYADWIKVLTVLQSQRVQNGGISL